MKAARLLYLLFLFPALFLAPAGAAGQASQPQSGEGESAQTEDEPPIQVRFTAFTKPNTDREFALRVLDQEDNETERSKAFEIPTHGFGPPVGASARAFQLGLVPEGGEAGAEDAPFRKLAEIELPEEGKAFLLLLLPKSGRGGLDIRVVRADDPEFKAGRARLFNLGDARVAWRLGPETDVIRPGAVARVRPPALEDEDASSYPVEFYYETEDGPKRFTATRWVPSPGVRTFVFFFPEPETGAYAYRLIEESPGWAEGE